MAIFKAPRITSSQRGQITLQASEIVYDIDEAAFYGGNGSTLGGFPIGQGASGGVPETFTLTAQDITNKYVVLSREPFLPEALTLNIVGGIPQLYGIDFIVSGLILSWDGRGLDNFLEVGDTLIIHY